MRIIIWGTLIPPGPNTAQYILSDLQNAVKVYHNNHKIGCTNIKPSARGKHWPLVHNTCNFDAYIRRTQVSVTLLLITLVSLYYFLITSVNTSCLSSGPCSSGQHLRRAQPAAREHMLLINYSSTRKQKRSDICVNILRAPSPFPKLSPAGARGWGGPAAARTRLGASASLLETYVAYVDLYGIAVNCSSSFLAGYWNRNRYSKKKRN